MKLSSNLIEAANRAEATAILIRKGYKVYRPEADDQGEDLVLRTPNGALIAVQLKGRLHVERAKYGERDMWMLFPCSPWNSKPKRDWFLVPHDELFAVMKQRHGHAMGFAEGKWTVSSPAQDLRPWLEDYRVTV
jgi:hypothetical protein